MYESRILAAGKSTVVTALAAIADVGMNNAEKSRRGKTTIAGVHVTEAAIILRRNMIL